MDLSTSDTDFAQALPQTCTCRHCGLTFSAADAILHQSPTETLLFCCRGCKGAYLVITESGLGDFYTRRSWNEPGLPEGAFQSEYPEEAWDCCTLSKASESEIRLIIEGVRCASCIWLIEKLVGRLDGVHSVRVNFGTLRALIRFNPSLTGRDIILSKITSLGYRPCPLTQSARNQSYALERKALLLRLGTAFFLSMQLMGYSLALYAGYFQGMDINTWNLMQLFSAALTTPVVFYCGYPLLRGAVASLKNRTPNMDLLLSLGILTAYFFSLFSLVEGQETYFDTAAMIVTLILLGRTLEMAARKKASSAIDRLLSLAPETASRIEGDEVRPVRCTLLQTGDRILVRPGERFAVDGTILSGETEVDESTITGEALPVHRKKGEAICAGSLNLSCSVELEVDRPASESFLTRIARIVEEAQARRAPVQHLADRVSALFVPTVLSLALLTLLLGIYFKGDGRAALLSAVSVLVIACPCALGLATPMAILVASSAAASRGILFRGGDVIERCSAVDLAAFDKTGTLTPGTLRITKLYPESITEEKLLTLAAWAEKGSVHPIAKAIVEEAGSRGIFTPLPLSTTTRPGRGLSAETSSGTVLVGNRLFLAESSIPIPALPLHNFTEVLVAHNGRYLGCIQLQDGIRQEAASVAGLLGRMGIAAAILTGDRQEPAALVARATGIFELNCNLTPEAKAEWIQSQLAQGRKVLMAGDGINDAPALSTASVSCAMAGGTDIALETSDIILASPNLLKIPQALALARRTVRVIRQNLFWAFFYNVIAIPLAVAGKLLPVHAAAAMALSSIFVILNSLRLALKKGDL